ncbi:MAG: hypothetical protein Q4C68_06845 [Moraxella sp.]|nr:hypothetical protein [Moraxella sp.]
MIKDLTDIIAKLGAENERLAAELERNKKRVNSNLEDISTLSRFIEKSIDTDEARQIVLDHGLPF